MIMVTVQVADFGHENFNLSWVMRCDLVEFQVILVLSQVVNANPSDCQVYHTMSRYLSRYLIRRKI